MHQNNHKFQQYYATTVIEGNRGILRGHTQPNCRAASPTYLHLTTAAVLVSQPQQANNGGLYLATLSVFTSISLRATGSALVSLLSLYIQIKPSYNIINISTILGHWLIDNLQIASITYCPII